MAPPTVGGGVPGPVVVGSYPPISCHWHPSPNPTQTHMSFKTEVKVSGVGLPLSSKPDPPKRKRLPNLSVHPAAPYRAPGVLVRGFGVEVGTVVGNEPYAGAEGTSTPAVLVPSIQVQSSWPQSITMLVMAEVTTPL